MLVSYLPFRLAQKHYFSRPAQLPIWRVYVAYTSMHRLRLQLLRFIANNSFAPLRAPTIPPPPPRDPITPSTVFPRSSVSLYPVHGKYGPRVNWTVCCVLRCNWYTRYVYIYIYIYPMDSNVFQPTSVFVPVFLRSLVVRSSLRENFVNTLRRLRRIVKRR